MEILSVIPEQTKIKHQLLRNYISPWMSILLSQQEKLGLSQKLLYFDGFSGPGIYYEDDTKTSTCHGSPLIVAEIANKYLDANPKREISIICIDKNKECVDMLNPKLTSINKYNQYWEAHHAEFDIAVNSLLDNIEGKNLNTPPMFFFIDPYGYSGFPLETLKRILKYPRAELFINFMIYDIVRYCEEKSKEKSMVRLFGCNEFKNIEKFFVPEKKQNFLMNLYCVQLKGPAGAEYVMPFRVNAPGQGSRPRYYLIHVSKNLKALKEMKNNMAKISDSPYNFEAIGVERQLDIFKNYSLTNQIKKYCSENTITGYDDIVDWAYVHTNGVENNIKRSILDLENNSIVKIKRKPAQRKHTVTKGAIIIYGGIKNEHKFKN